MKYNETIYFLKVLKMQDMNKDGRRREVEVKGGGRRRQEVSDRRGRKEALFSYSIGHESLVHYAAAPPADTHSPVALDAVGSFLSFPR